MYIRHIDIHTRTGTIHLYMYMHIYRAGEQYLWTPPILEADRNNLKEFECPQQQQTFKTNSKQWKFSLVVTSKLNFLPTSTIRGVQSDLSIAVCMYIYTRCNTLQHFTTTCQTLYHHATPCKTLQHTATHCNTLQHAAEHCKTHCNTLQNAATHCTTLQYTLRHTAIHTATN